MTIYKKVLTSLVVLGLFTISGFSQGQEQKNPKAIGQAVLGENFDLPAYRTLASPADLAFTGEYSVGSGGQNCHYLGFVQAGDHYRIEVRGVGGFDPVAMSIRAVLDTGNPQTFVGINDDCPGLGLDSCLDFNASGSGALTVCVRGFAGAGGRYRLRLDVD